MAERKKSIKAFTFSLIIAVYNTEQYLDETIESVLEQDFDVAKDVQIVLVNDGSTDGSGAICEKYKALYPDNVVYISQKNGGVSKARNNGLAKATGTYVSFLDSDDKLSPDTLAKVYDFFDAHQKDIDVVSFKMIHFDADHSGHVLNYIYKDTRVVDMWQEYDVPQLSTSSVFIKRSALRGRTFHPSLTHMEDARLITELLLEKMKFGVVAEPIYYYRRRKDEKSASTGSTTKPSWYINTMEHFHKYIADYSRKKFGKIPEYVQFLIMYDLQWRLTQINQAAIDKEQLQVYKQQIVDVLQDVGDDIILKQRHIPIEFKLFTLSKKHGGTVYKKVTIKKRRCYINDTCVYDYHINRQTIQIELFDIRDSVMMIEGRMRGLLLDGVTLGVTVNGEFHAATMVKRPVALRQWFGEPVYDGNCFKLEVPIHDKDILVGALRFSDGTMKKIPFGKYPASRLPSFYGRPYRAVGSYLVAQHGSGKFIVTTYTPWRRFKKELKHQFFASRMCRFIFGIKDFAKRQPRYQGTMLLRAAYFAMRPFARHKIWILSDRADQAGDNGEAMFRYLQTTIVSRNKKVYFAINKDSPDYKRLRQYGKVIDRRSWRYKLLFLRADKVISSHADGFITNPFGRQYQYLCDLLQYDFVFLQHGITKDDISGWLNKWAKNIKLFVTVTPEEMKSIASPNYGYDKRVVKLTGFPRYDLLDNQPKNKLIIAPTWRKSLTGAIDHDTGLRPRNSKFTSTEYYRFYNGLLNDKRVLAALRNHNMTAELYIHPALSAQVRDFKDNDIAKVIAPPYDYKTVFREGSILVTDFSSVAFDFAYLKKPVVYSQYDIDEFYSSHTVDRGYFSYEKHGFGPVATNYESAVEEIVKAIEGGAIMPKKYLNRVDKFFAYTDKNNCKRVYEAIKAMDEEK